VVGVSEQAHRIASKLPPIGLARVQRRLLRAIPIEDRHQLVLGRAILSRDRRPRLAKAMS
jgi:hypothetical protein